MVPRAPQSRVSLFGVSSGTPFVVTAFPLRFLLVTTCIVGVTVDVCAQTSTAPIGRIKNVSGTASISRGGQSVAATVGATVFEADVLRTAADGQLGIMLRDETRLSLGPASEFAIREFAFAPAEGRMGLVLRVLRGAMAYVSGRIAALAPDRVRIETPSMVIGVRGTHILVRAETP